MAINGRTEHFCLIDFIRNCIMQMPIVSHSDVQYRLFLICKNYIDTQNIDVETITNHWPYLNKLAYEYG